MSQESDAVAATDRADGEIMAAVEEGRQAEFVIADISRDGAYLSVPLAEAASLSDWR